MKIIVSRIVVEKAWDEDAHPRHPTGDPRGGQFAPKAGAGAGAGGVEDVAKAVRNRKWRELATSADTEAFEKEQPINAGPATAGSVREYTEFGFWGINRYLRGQITFYEEEEEENKQVRAKYEKHIANIDELLSATPLPDDLVVFRGLRHDVNLDLDFVAGEMFVDKGFVSASTSEKFARDWLTIGDIKWDKGAVLRIHAPKGSKAAYLDGLSTREDEREVLIARKSQFLVLGVDKKKRTVDVLLVQNP